MSDLNKLIEGLPIKILDKDCAEIDGGRYLRSQIKHWADTAPGTGQQLGWRLTLHLMDEYEEPKLVGCDGPFPDKTGEYAASIQEPKPTWERGTLIKSVGDLWTVRLDEFISFAENGDEKWKFTVFDSGQTGQQCFVTRNWTVHRLPHEFKVGDWVEYRGVMRRSFFQVARVEAIFVLDDCGNSYAIKACRHAPAPKNPAPIAYNINSNSQGAGIVTASAPCQTPEPKEDPFTGPHWDTSTLAACLQRTKDLANELLRQKKDK